MDRTITVIIGATIFSAFVLGLAESIDSVPFVVIVVFVVVLMSIDAFELIREQFRFGKARKDGKK